MIVSEFEYKGHKMKMLTTEAHEAPSKALDPEKAVMEMKQMCEDVINSESCYYTEDEKELAKNWLDKYNKLFKS